jgi:ferritin
MHVNQWYGISITINFLSWFIKDFIEDHNKLRSHG